MESTWMAWTGSKTPQRIPPPRLKSDPSPPSGPADSPATARVVRAQATPSTPPPPPPTAADDAFALESQFDRLVDEFERLKDQLRQAQKLASIGTTAAMIAHEFNNLLTPIMAYAHEALQRSDPQLARTALTKTLERATVLRQMADRVVGLARQPEVGIRAVRLKPVADEAIACLGRDLSRDNITTHVQIDPELQVRANENQLLQVLFNLVINARQAMLGRRGRLTIDAAPAENAVCINVRDTGCGIPPENLPHIFEPFFSTKCRADRPDARGLGLGLAISRDIITDLRGEVRVTSEVGVGTTFTLTLPQA